MHNDQNESTKDVENSHDWNEFLCNGCDTTNTTQENKASQNCYNDTYINWIDTKCAFKCSTNGVCLYHVSEETKSQCDQNCEDSSQNFTKCAFVSCADIVNRTPGNLPSIVNCLIFLCKRCFYEDGSHTEDSGYPHPEDSTRTTHYHSSCSTSQVTCTYLSSNRSCQGLEGRHTVFASLFTVQFDVTKYCF